MIEPIPEADRKALAGAARKIAKATGLPNWLYADPAALAREKQALFAAGWAGAGFAHDVPDPGDVKPVTLLGEPLLLARDMDGGLRVFQNACRHRGVALVERARATTGLLRCPYHAWCYDLKGRLRQTPHAGGPGIHEHPDLKKDRLGLVEIRSHEWLGVVFVNLSGKAASFAGHFAGLAKRWADFDKPVHFGGTDSEFSLDLRSNWKLAVENYCESYHLPFVHPGLNSYSRLEDHENILGKGPWSGQLTRVYNPQPDATGRRFAEFPGLPKRWDRNAEYLALYPNVLLGVHKDHTFAILLDPQAGDRTIERIAIFYASPDMQGASWSAMRQRNAQMWKDVFVEDIGVVEAMQVGRGASAFDGGHFSPVMDEATHHFHVWAAKALLDTNKTRRTS
jgi:phenylpropionate dioxygenase-like ring-hydroxylating dioxygenase large terminal subunit